MTPDPEQLPPDAPAIDLARAWASVGNTSFCNHWLGQVPDATDDLVMELRELARWKCLRPDRIGRLKEPERYRPGYQMEMF